MLSYALAITVGLSSLVLFSTAFLMSDIHRQDDFFWSGIGLFYALVLWFYATSITGGVLLGQAAAAALVVSYNWQTLKLRKAIANPEKATELNNFSVLQAVSGLLNRGKSKPQPTLTKTTVTTPKVTEQEIVIPEKTADEVAPVTPSPQQPAEINTSVAAPANSKKTNQKPGLLGKFLRGKNTSAITNTKLDDILDDQVNEPSKIAKTVAETKSAAPDITVTAPETSLETPVEIAKSTEPPAVDEISKVVSADHRTTETTTSISKPVDTVEEMETPAKSTTEESQTIEPKTKELSKESSMDLLETVEVAEVLEADTSSVTNKQKYEQSKIIEVTTTEIETSTNTEVNPEDFNSNMSEFLEEIDKKKEEKEQSDS
jgi:hypothetical protein